MSQFPNAQVSFLSLFTRLRVLFLEKGPLACPFTLEKSPAIVIGVRHALNCSPLSIISQDMGVVVFGEKNAEGVHMFQQVVF